MVIQSPRYHLLSNSYELICKDKFVWPWEIGVPKEDSFEWSVIMAHLMSVRPGRNFQKEFKDRVDSLGYLKNYREIKSALYSFNPFLNRYSCFFNESLKRVVEDFKQKTSTVDLASKIKVSSETLQTNIIVLITKDNEETVLSEELTCENIRSYKRKIILYCNLNSPDSDYKFHFGIETEKGSVLKKTAFFKILKQAGIPMRKKLFSLYKENESFVISVVKSDNNIRSTIPKLYKSSYHAWKLEEAGFRMDPKVIDANGFSALYYALISNDEKSLYTLHNYAANACHYSEKTFREPDGFIIRNLKSLLKTLENDKKTSNNFQENESFILTAKQLIQFTEFLYSMCNQLVKKQKSSKSISASKELQETEHRKSVILTVLKTYVNFFFIDKEEIFEKDPFPIDLYCKYENYYRYLDNSAALFFFDNIFYLKERLKLPNNEYSELESAFCLCILSNKYSLDDLYKSLKRMKPEYQKTFKHFIKDKVSSNNKYFKLIPMFERLELRQKVRRFIKILEKVKILPEEILRNVPEEEIQKTLSNLPVLKDEFYIRRLIHYGQTALNQNLRSIKQILIIKRTLQILGETLIHGSRNRNSLCFLLFISLPEDIYQTLKQIRDSLSNLKKNSFIPKLKAEKTFLLFSNVLKDLKDIFEKMQGIFDIQLLRLENFIFQRGLQKIQNFKVNKSVLAGINIKLSPVQLSEASLYLEKIIHAVDDVKCNADLNLFFQNEYVLKNLKQSTDAMLQNEALWTDKLLVLKNAEHLLWPLKYLLTFTTENSTEINLKIKEFVILSEQVYDKKQKIEEIWGKYKILIVDVVSKNPCQENTRISASNIEKLKEILKRFEYFTEEEKREIRSRILANVYTSVKKIHDFKKCLQSKTPLTSEQISQFPENFLPEANLRQLKSLDENDSENMLKIIEDADDPLRDLNSLLDGTYTASMNKVKLNKLCKHMHFSDEIKGQFLSVIAGKKKVAKENKFDILLNRVMLLKDILINEDPDICELWNKGFSAKTKEYALDKMVQRYANYPDVQASVEMLLFDCMNLFKNITNIENLWIKTSSLFSGINLRNVLGHGSPNLENIGKLLDPEDLPSELVKQMLQLVKDEQCIRLINYLCLATASDFSKFHKLMNDDDFTEHADIRKKIKDCPRWKIYSKLLLLEITRSEILLSEALSSSINCDEFNES